MRLSKLSVHVLIRGCLSLQASDAPKSRWPPTCTRIQMLAFLTFAWSSISVSLEVWHGAGLNCKSSFATDVDTHAHTNMHTRTHTRSSSLIVVGRRVSSAGGVGCVWTIGVICCLWRWWVWSGGNWPAMIITHMISFQNIIHWYCNTVGRPQ